MNTREKARNYTHNKKLKEDFEQLATNMLTIYSRFGENTECMKCIQEEIKHFYQSKLKQHDGIKEIIHSHLISGSKVDAQKAYKIVDNNKFKVALHITRKGIKFPIHSHPRSLNSLLVIRGTVKVNQYGWADLIPKSKECSLNAGICSVGLQKNYNVHTLETEAPFNVFVSIRCKVLRQKILQYKLPKLFALGLGLLASFSSYAAQQVSVISLLSTSTQSNMHQQVESNMELVSRANSLRVKNEEAQYDAAQLYKVAANKNNPEAQYWLGYMYLMGMGITEDNDEALNWIAASARQSYPPAENLLNRLLDTESEYDC